MNNSNWLGLAVVTIILLLLVLAAVHLDPTLGGVIGSILLGIAAVIRAIRTRNTQSTTDDESQNSEEPSSGSDKHDHDTETDDVARDT